MRKLTPNNNLHNDFAEEVDVSCLKEKTARFVSLNSLITSSLHKNQNTFVAAFIHWYK
jgi:hypothetical protein